MIRRSFLGPEKEIIKNTPELPGSDELIQTKESENYPGLFVRKYKKKVFFKNLWHKDPQLLESRGRVYNAKGDVVINPFTKVFNFGENGTTIGDDEPCLYIGKINGFMACVTWVPEVNDVVVSTTGSLDSDYVEMARKSMPKVLEIVKRQQKPITYIFEVCHPNDPHIVPENIGVYLIGARDVSDNTPYYTSVEKELELDNIAKLFGALRPTYSIDNFKNIKDLTNTVGSEGFMVYGLLSGTSLKMKSSYYLSCKAIARKKDIMTLDKSRVDEEFYPIIDELKEQPMMNEQERLDFIRDYFKVKNET